MMRDCDRHWRFGRAYGVFKLAGVLLLASGADLNAQAVRPPVVVSPEILDDRRVTFRLWAPQATEVQLTADWMGRQPPAGLAKGADGIWSVTVGPLEPNLYTYAFLVDGVRASDPACRCSLTSAGRFSLSRLAIRGPDANVWDERDVPKGTLHHESFSSKQLQRTSRFVVYTPPGYERQKDLPVLVLLPGTPGDEWDWTRGGGFADVMFDNLIADGKMTPMVVVMHASDVLKSGRRVEHLAAFEPMLVNELAPEIRRRYRVARKPEAWGIAGLSLGGEFAMTVGLRHPELFRSVASISGSMVEADFEDRYGKAFAAPERIRRDYRLIWMGCGDEDIFAGGNRALAGKFRAIGLQVTTSSYSGGHQMPVFRRELVDLLPRLFK